MPKFVVIDAYINTVPGGRDYTPLAEICKREGYELFIEDMRDTREIIHKVKDADGIITVFTKIDQKILNHCANLKIVIRAGIGPDVFNLDDCTAANIPACNVPTYCTEEVACHTVALALALLRKLSVSDRLVRSGDWNGSCIAPAHRLSTLTFGFVGFGRIARRAYEMARAFGFTFCAYDPYLPDSVFEEMRVEKVTCEELYERCDLISVNAPLTDDTYHLIDKAAVARMKNGVCIVNTGRGGCIETAAILEGLKSGKISGAGLDVLEEEPLRDRNAELLKHKNVLITSHTAYYSLEAREELYRITGETLVRVMNGELPDNVLNRNALLAKRGQTQT